MFKSPITPMPKDHSHVPRKLVTTSRLRAMEENIWSELHGDKMNDDVDDKEAEPQDGEDDDDWGNSGWDAEEFEDMDEKPTPKPQTISNSKTGSKLKLENKKANPKSSGWDNWDDNDFGSEWNNPTTEKEDQNSSKSGLAPASSYDWSDTKAQNPDSDDFFTDIITKPAPKPSQSRKKTTPLRTRNMKTSATSTVAKPEKTDSVEGWGWDDAGGDDWNEDQGLSKAELMKKQREEKRRQRQEEIEKKRAARAGGGGKFGARKVD